MIRKIRGKERNFDEMEAQYTTEKKKYQKTAFGLQVRVKLKIKRKIKRKEKKFDKIEAQYTREKKKYQKAAFGLQVRFEKRKISTGRGGCGFRDRIG
jgi:hypothetical protein